MPLGTTYDDVVLDGILGSGHLAGIPATVYVALLESGVEVSGVDYARVTVSNTTANWPAASGGGKPNGVPVLFPVAGGSWGTPDELAIMDAPTGGNVLATGTITTPTAIGLGDAPYFPVGDIELTTP